MSALRIVVSLCLASSLGLCAPQGGDDMPMEPRYLYFEPTPDIKTTADCEAASGTMTLHSADPIILTSEDKTLLCVFFIEGQVWHLSQGSVGNAGIDGCVDWVPPTVSPPEADLLLPFRFASVPSSGSCDSVTDADSAQGVPLAKGELGKRIEVCFNLKNENLEDKYHKVAADPTSCGVDGCCRVDFILDPVFGPPSPRELS